MLMEDFATASDWEKFNSSLLIEVTRSTGVFTCSGIAVSGQLVITAAHCLEGDVKKVRVFTQESYNPAYPSLEVESFKIHQNYNPQNSPFVSDLAKIKMKKNFLPFIKLYPIYTGTSFDSPLYRFGFGARNKKNLRTVITPKFKTFDHVQHIIELNDMFSRSGDSGGPIYIQNGKDIFVLAIHSTFSHGPEGNFSYNPLLAPYLPWIYEN